MINTNKGVMGTEVAKSLYNKYPLIYRVYKNSPLAPDSMTLVQVTKNLTIANAIT